MYSKYTMYSVAWENLQLVTNVREKIHGNRSIHFEANWKQTPKPHLHILTEYFILVQS